MTEPSFDHERLGVYRLSIDYVAFSYEVSLRSINATQPRAANRVLLGRLPSDPLGVEVASSHQTLMVPFIDDAPLVHHEDLGRMPNGA